MKSSINSTRTEARIAFEDSEQEIAIGVDWRTPGIHSRKPRKPLPDRVTKSIRVLVADDHAVVRAGLRALLEAAGDMQVIGEAENGMQAVQETRRLQPDVVLLDLAMPLLNGVEAARQIVQESPEAAVLILSSYNDAQHLRRAVEAGAAGYLMKESAAADLLEAVRETRNGGSFFSPALFQLLLKGLRGGANEPGSAARTTILTWREAEVLQLVAEGYATKQIARLLILSNKTVEKHRQTLMEKLDIHNIANLTSYAVANGIVDLADIPEQTPAWPVGGAPWTTENISPGEVTAKGCHRTNKTIQIRGNICHSSLS
jgi:DNA-binding NarL/FixJ family response regulator